MKLTRKQIKESLDAVPIDTVLLGTTSKTTTLTPKQREFARQMALGKSKAESYRQSYKNKANPRTASKKGQELTKLDSIQAQIDAFKLAFEAQQYATPANLRMLTIHKLTEKALDENVPPAQQIKALELLGKITEVALFTERRELVTINSSEQIKEKLLKSLTLAIKSSGATNVADTSAESLLREITGEALHDDEGNRIMNNSVVSEDNVIDAEVNEKKQDGDGVSNQDLAQPTEGESPFLAIADSPTLHSIPHTQSAENIKTQSNQDLRTITGVKLQENPNMGGGGTKSLADSLEADLGTPPVSQSGSQE